MGFWQVYRIRKSETPLKNLSLLKNWRPISLLNVDYKIATKALDLKKVPPSNHKWRTNWLYWRNVYRRKYPGDIRSYTFYSIAKSRRHRPFYRLRKSFWQLRVCAHCNSLETPPHMLVNCTEINSFWAKIISWWNNQSGYGYLVDELSILYGCNPEDKWTLVFNYFILLGKRHIFTQRFE